MAYIKTGVNQPGIVELLFYKGSTGNALSNLAHTLLHGPSGLSRAERELIASYVSKLNDCEFCHKSHSASANAHLGDEGKTVACLVEDMESAPVSDKLKSLLSIAAKVQKSGKLVSQQDVDIAKEKGASEEDIHDAVLIAAAFCMYNRYVDGLGTTPAETDEYPDMGKRLAKKGYKYPPVFLRSFIVKLMNRKRKKSAKAV
ncbi:carboxymuconolactone decarboxylase family protein [Echinicola shivajiensis]|uniref:carboxymuconolactone decarboxylase family protein n=1 Tax=Echinicola shivajiensis TaxID=1035916 RepID=UPI001BFC8945|nr:carboxymuconolactone decarboxylase family protein [Echinicola shivajiensis]